MALALRLLLEETASFFAGVCAPARFSSLSTELAAACIPNELFMMSELRAALQLILHRFRYLQNADQGLLNLPDQALVQLLNWYNEV